MKKRHNTQNNQVGVIRVTTKVQKWGNSLAVRIPSSIADRVSIDQGSEVELSLNNQTITVKPVKKKPSLDELLSLITPENRHTEIDFGKPEGNELI